jgi:N-acetylmuramoyl-L-alanine amidase
MIVIDAGHGGSDGGAIAGGVREKHLALIYALSLGGELCRLGVPVLYTRTDDTYPSLSERAALANERNARAFISVHFNASDNTTASGIWLLHAMGAPGGTGLAHTVQRTLGGAVHPDASGWTGNRRLAVLRQTQMPAVLIEYGFLTNPGERTLLQSVEYMRALVEKTAAALRGWIA